MLRSGYDVDASGKFLRGADGYDMGEGVDYHDLDGVEHDTPIPRIIGKTNPKAETLAEGHPGNTDHMSVSQKVEH